MQKLFYTVYSPSTGNYIGEGFEFVAFDRAVRFANRSDAQYELDGLEVPGDLKVVGPCNEGDYK